MVQNPRKIVFTTIGVIFFVLVMIFAYGRFGRYLHGPFIEEISLDEFQTIESNSLVVSGVVKNVQTMSINGRTLALDKNQHFSEHVVVPPGHSTIDITVVDAFEKQRSYTYTIYSEHTDVMLPVSYSEAMSLHEPKTEDALPSDEDTLGEDDEVTETETLTNPNE